MKKDARKFLDKDGLCLLADELQRIRKQAGALSSAVSDLQRDLLKLSDLSVQSLQAMEEAKLDKADYEASVKDLVSGLLADEVTAP